MLSIEAIGHFLRPTPLMIRQNSRRSTRPMPRPSRRAARADGREAVRKVWQGAMDAGVTNVKVRTVEVAVSGNFAYESGEYSLDAPGKDGKLAHSAGKYVVVWKRSKTGTWQLYRDIWNESPA